MTNYLRLALLSISLLAVSASSAIAADLSTSRSTSNPDLIAQTPSDLQTQAWMFKGVAICGQVERQLRTNPNNFQLRQLHNSCIFMFKKQGLCQTNQIISSPPNLYVCNEELAEFARQWE
jgi:hypothetical protein